MRNSNIAFNELGRSIESSCMLFIDKKWKESYMVCSQPNDTRDIFLIAYKNQKNRLKNKQLFTIKFDTLVGFESGFLLKKETNTLCMITQLEVVIAAFSSVQNLICWESWLHQSCCRGAMFYAQLIEAPPSSRASHLINREIRVHIHDGRLALVGGNPAELIGYWNRNEIDEVNFGQNVMHFNGVDCRAEDMGIFALICGQIQPLAHFFSLSMRPGSLISYLNRKTADGAWMNTIPTGKLNTSSHLITSTDVNPHPLISNHVTIEAQHISQKQPTESEYCNQMALNLTRPNDLTNSNNKIGSSLSVSQNQFFSNNNINNNMNESRERSFSSFPSAILSRKAASGLNLYHSTNNEVYQNEQLPPKFTRLSSVPFYVNYDFVTSNNNTNQQQQAVSNESSSSPSSALKNCITYVNISGGNTVTTKANCGIRRAASDMPYYMNVNNDSSHYNSFSTGHLTNSTVVHNNNYQYINEEDAIPHHGRRVFNPECAFTTANVKADNDNDNNNTNNNNNNNDNNNNNNNNNNTDGALNYKQTNPSQSNANSINSSMIFDHDSDRKSLNSRKIICRAGSWPKHVYKNEYDQHRRLTPTSMKSTAARHLSASSIAMNGGLHSSLRSTASERCSASALIPTSRAGAVETVLDEDCKTATSTGALATVNENRGAGKYVRQLQKTTRNRGRDAADFKDKSRLSQHQRSRSVGLEASVKRSGSTREENWDRAKRIIGGVRKSVNRNAMMIQSASLDKLVSSPIASSTTTTAALSTHVLSNANALEVSSSHAVEELPKLDVSVCNADNTPNNVASTVSLQGSSSIPGLIKLPPERFALKKMGNIFTKNLRKSITGSYSKYDGERATHHYNPGNAAAESPLPAVFDCLESAVNKGRARLIEADRRNSSFAEGLHSTAVKSSMQMQPRRYTLSSKACASGQPYQMSSAAVEKLESNADSHHPPANTCYYSPLQKTNPNINDKPPPLPPRTYLKNKQLRQSQQKVNDEATVRSKTDESVNLPSQSTTSVNTSTVRRPLQGSYCTVVSPSSNNNTRLSISANTSSSVRPSSQKSAPISSIHQAHTVYTQIDPIATMAATQTQADMMKERERHVPQQQRLITQSVYASDRSLGSRSKRNINSDDRTNSISTKRFFSKHIWRKPSKSHSHSDLRF